MSFSFQDTDRATFECLLSEEQHLKLLSGGVATNSARTTIKWQRLCEKMFNLCCRKDPMETMFTFYNASSSGSFASDPILEYQQMIQLMKNMLFSYYPDITTKSLWGPQATPVPVQRDSVGFVEWDPTPQPIVPNRTTEWGGEPGQFTFGVTTTREALGFDAFFAAEKPSKNPEPEKEEENPKN